MRTRWGGRERTEEGREKNRKRLRGWDRPGRDFRWLNVRGGFELCCDRSWTYEGRDRCCTAIRLTRLFWDNGYYLIAEYRAIADNPDATDDGDPSDRGVDGISRTKCIPLHATVPNGFCMSRTSLSRKHREKFVLGSYLSKLTKWRWLREILVKALTCNWMKWRIRK